MHKQYQYLYFLCNYHHLICNWFANNMIIVRIVILIKCLFRNACILNHGNHGTIITIALAGPCIGILNDFSLILFQILNLMQYVLPQAQIYKCLIDKYFVIYYTTISVLYLKCHHTSCHLTWSRETTLG